MKKNDKINLDSISNINEKIIDEVTDKKISLLQKLGGNSKNLRKRLIAIGSIAASFALIFSVLLAIIIPMLGSAVPVYQGMTIRQDSASSMNIQEYDFSANVITLLSASSGNNGFTFLSNSNGNAYGHDKDNHKDKNDKLKNDIEDIVVIDVKTDDEVRYYVKPGETFIIEIHIDNPRDYEIQSFTLNGQKYANYMFKEGSTMELLLLEVTAPSEPGYVEYTIDAIKYIDGTEIKDVDMSSGDKSIKAGIAYPTAPSASVTSQSVMPTSIELSVNIVDTYKLIGQNELAIYLSDGENIIDSKPLTVGKNNITFDNLSINKTYEYGVVTAYDLVDGKNLHKEWLLTNTITTAGAFGISNATSTQTSISFEVEKIGEVGEITSISLFDAATDEHIASGGAEIREFSGLLSNHTYNLYVDFKYTVNGEEIADWVAINGIQTKAKNEPTVSFGSVSFTVSTVSGVFNMTDPDGIGTVGSVELYKDGSLVKNNAEKQINFTELNSYTAYQIVVTYTFDLNDGVGLQTKTAIYYFKTAPYIATNSCSIINTDGVAQGDTIYMQLDLVNPSGATPTGVVIGGRRYDCASATGVSKVYVEIVNDGQFDGGETNLTVDEILVSLDGKDYALPVIQNNTDSVFIYGNLELTALDWVVLEDGQYVVRDYVNPGETVFLRMTLLNQTGYNIDSLQLAGVYTSATVDTTSLIKLDDEHYLIERALENGRNSCYIDQITYSTADFSKTVQVGDHVASIYQLVSAEVVSVSTPDDLLHMNEGKRYVLANDIDLSDITWRGAKFDGVFDGDGHSIINMTRVGTISGQIGLFTSGSGIIKNVNLKKVTFILAGSSNVGALLGSGTVSIDNCHVDGDSVIIANGTVGGLIGCLDLGGSSVTHCTSSASVSIGDGSVGGIAGRTEGYIANCINYGTVTASGGSAGGIAGAGGSNVSFERCANYGTVTVTDGFAAGIAYSGSFFKRCANYGAVSVSGLGARVAGIVCIVQHASNGFVENCVNYGKISGAPDGYAAGIVVMKGDGVHSLSIKNCANYGEIHGDQVEGMGIQTRTSGIVSYNDQDMVIENCINVGQVTILNFSMNFNNVIVYGLHPIYSAPTIVNCYALDGNVNPKVDFYEGLTLEAFNVKAFYTDTLGWSEDIWNLDDLDVENGKYPTLK